MSLIRQVMFLSDPDMNGIGGKILDTRLWAKASSCLNRELRESADEELAVRIHYWGVSPEHYDNPVHKHSFFEMCYVIDREGTYHEGDREYPLRKGTLFLSRPHAVHRICSAGMPLLFIAFELIEERTSPVWKESFSRLAAAERFVLEEMDETVTGLLWRALVLQASGEGAGASGAKLAHLLLSSFPAAFGIEGADRERTRSPEASSALLRQATLFIRDNLSQPLQLNGVASYLHISARHLSRLFAQELSMTFVTYVRMERVNQAARLLRQSELSIKQIAEVVGFGSVHYFTRVFAEVAGMTPAVFRGAH